MIWKTFTVAIAAVAPYLLAAPIAAGQSTTDDGWNGHRTIELVRRAIERRSIEVVDSALQTYSAEGRGYVYFLLDAPEIERQTLVRTDQVAVEVFWRAPNEARQRIVGMREQRELPVTRLYYYLDRLTVVQDSYGQSIVIADGDNVNDVPHPIGSTGEEFYDYLLADSLILRLPGVPDPVRVHEVRVRPKFPDVPAVIGSVFLEGTTGALVRMNFTFTPSAYIDPRLDFINVTLENGLWRGRFWLPHEQRLEIRREMPELDLPFGTVIRTRMRIGDYVFNEPLPEWLFINASPITIAPRAEREAFPFEEPIDAEWRLEGIAEPADVEEVRRVARSMLRERAVSGLPRGRISVGSASDLFRYNRAEGAALGIGASVRPLPGLTGRVYGGWAFGADHPLGEASITTGDHARLTLGAYANRRRDVGRTDAVSGIVNTLGSLFVARDYTDPFYATGAEATAQFPLDGAWSALGSIRFERQRSATATTDYSIFDDGNGFRPVRGIDRGDNASFAVGLRREQESVSGGWWLDGSLGAARLDGVGEAFEFGRAEVAAGMSWSRSAHRARVDLEGRTGLTAGEVPSQELYLIGGRGSLPGFDYRSFAGERMAVARLSASADLTHPWLRPKAFGAVGWTGTLETAAPWGSETSGLRASVGVGVGLFYDLLQVEVARGIGAGARTELIIEAQPSFWDFL